MTLLTFARRNVGRNGLRSVLTILGVAVAVVTIILLQTAISSWSLGADRAPKNRLMTRNRVAFELGLPRHYVDDVAALPDVGRVSWLSWFAGTDPRQPSQSISTYACDPASFLAVYDGIEVSDADRARWLADRTGVLVGEALAKRMSWKVGDRITLTGSIYPGDWEFNVAAIYRQTAPIADPGLFLLSWEYLNERDASSHMHDRVEYIWTKLKNPADASRVSQAIDALFEEREVATRTDDERAFFTSLLGMVSTVLAALDLITLAVVIIMAMLVRNAIVMAVEERTPEMVAMRALGFGGRLLVALIVLEALIVGLAGGLLGVALAYPIVDGLVGRWVESTLAALIPEFRVSATYALAALASALVVSVLVSMGPVLRVTRLEIAAGLRRIT